MFESTHRDKDLPPPLMTSEPGSFARFTLLERKPQITRQVIEDNDYPPDIVQALEALQEELASRPLQRLREQAPDAGFWNRELARYKGQTWLEVPWYFAEAVFYRRLLEAVRYFQPGPWQGHDPFGKRKREQETLAVQCLAASWGQLAEVEPETAGELLLHSCLWGNRADLSYHSVAQQARGGLADSEERRHLLIDHTDAARQLLAGGLHRVDVIADNAGMELLCDLALADFLLVQGWAQAVVFHLKDRPFFVSDAMPADVQALVATLQVTSDVAMQELGARLHGHLAAQRLVLRADFPEEDSGRGFWTSTRMFRELPPRLRKELQNADLVILKGDANYRRLLDDRHWPHTTRLEEVTGYFPAPFLTLRTLKAELMVDLQPGQADKLAAADPDWLINGKRGIIQLVEGKNMTAKRSRNPLQEHNLTKEQALDLLRQMWEIRIFENTVYDLLGRNVIKGASHLYAGQEAVAVGAISTLRDDDLITSTHRGHGHCHARGAVLAKTEDAKQEHLNKMMAELCGRATGYCRGRGGSMHIADVEKGNLGATGIVGGNIPVATGAGLAQTMQSTGRVVLCFFGDGAANTGNFHESLNLASLWDLPVVYIVENNLYGMSVPVEKATAKLDFADRSCAYGIPGEVVDGMDVLAVRQAVGRAVERARRGDGPSLIECQTYRWYGHSRSDPRAYRTKEEEAEWKARDPIPNFAALLVEAGIVTQEEVDALEEKVEDEIEAATEFALGSPTPPVEELEHYVYTPFRWTAADAARERELRERCRAGGPGTRQIEYRQAIQEALREEMQRDPRVFVMGEDVGLYGGAYGATKGLLKEFGPERVRDTPISEATIGGAAVGAAMSGLRPVAEIMYVDFTPLAMDQIANQGAKNRYMFGGKTVVPMVIRTEGGAGRSIAAHHSQSLEALWTHFPGIYVVMPSTPYDAKGLLKAAIRDDNPVMFIEHKMLYSVKGYVPDGEDADYIIPYGVADVKREGSDVTVVTYSRMVHRALEAAGQLAEEGISVEVIDLRTLKPLDMDTVAASVKKTGRVVGLSEAYKTGSFISELAMRIQEELFDWLDAPVVRVCAADVPVPMSEPLEDAAIPGVEAIIAGIRQVLR
ncbi:MAG: DUF89 family protein [Chloroflexi bacterium]|nr:DUF89 family protein [Chloroflexota bacterium]